MASVKFEYSILRDRQEVGYGTAVRSTKLREPAVNDSLLSQRRTGQTSEEGSEFDQMSLAVTLGPAVKTAEEREKLEQNFHKNLFPDKQDVVNRTSEEMMKIENFPLLVQQNHTDSQTTPVGKETHKNGRPCRKEPELGDDSTQEHACGKTSSVGSVCVCNEVHRLRRTAVLCSKTDSSKTFEEYFTRLQQSPILYLYDDNEFQSTVERIPPSIVLCIIVNESFYRVLQADISAMKQMLKKILDSKNELYFMNFLDDENDYLEVKYNLPREVRERWVDKDNVINTRDTRCFISEEMTDSEKEETNNNVQIGDENSMAVRTEKEETTNNVQVGDENTMAVRKEREETTNNVQVGDENTMEVRTEREETTNNVQVGDENTMEVRTEREETTNNVQVGGENTMEVRTEREETTNNVQVGDENTMAVRTEREETTNNVQVGDENTMEVRTEREETTNNVQVGDENTMEVRTEREETTNNVQVGDENTMEVRTEREETTNNVQVGGENTMEVRTEREETTNNVQVGDENTMEVRTEREETNNNVQVGDENTMEVRTEREETTNNVQVGDENRMAVRTEREETTNSVQIGDENTMVVRTEKEETNNNIQVGDENTMEVRTEKEETTNNVQVGDENTMEVRTEREETNNNVQVGDENTMEVRTEKEETTNNVQVGYENTMEVRTEREETNNNVQVGDENTMEVRTEKEETTNNVQVGDENTMAVRTEKEEISNNVQVGDENAMEVRTLADNVTSTQIGRKVLFQYRNDSSVEGIMLTIKTPEANHRLDVTIKKHIDDNLHHINVELRDLHVKVTSTDLGSVIIRVKVEEGTKLGDDWLKKVITTILSEEILSSLPVGTRMEVNIQASLSLKPLNVDIFETTTKVDDSIPLLREVMTHQGNSFVHKVAARGSTNLLDRLIESGVDINIRNKEGHTLLHTGAKAGNIQAVQMLIEKGANIALRDVHKRTPLHLAAMEGKIQCIEELMRAGGSGKEETIEIPDPKKNESEIYQIVQGLLAAGADINATDPDSTTPLHIAAQTGDLDILNLLLQYEPDVKRRDSNGQTALHVAVANGNFKWGSRLVKYDPRTLHVKDKGGNTPLHGNRQISRFQGGLWTLGTPLQYAAMHKQVASVWLLIKLGADVNENNWNGNTLLHNVLRLLKPFTCQSNKNLECAKEFLQFCKGEDLNAKNMDGNTPLLTAVLRKDLQFARSLIEEGADVKISNKRGETVLHALVNSAVSCLELTRIVLAKGADVDAKDERGDTPLHFAVLGNNRLMIKELLVAGANVYEENESKMTPFEGAKRSGSFRLKLLFEKYKVRQPGNEEAETLFDLTELKCSEEFSSEDTCEGLISAAELKSKMKLQSNERFNTPTYREMIKPTVFRTKTLDQRIHSFRGIRRGSKKKADSVNPDVFKINF